MGRKESNQTKTTIWATLVEKLKVNLDLWNLFIAIVALGLTYQVKNIDFGFNGIQKINFSKNFPFECIRMQIDLDVKEVKVNLGSWSEQTW